MMAERTSDDRGDQDPTTAANSRERLGPLIWRERLQRPVAGRLAALVIFAACSSGIGLAAWLVPDGRGYGTHRTLGLGPCGSRSTRVTQKTATQKASRPIKIF